MALHNCTRPFLLGCVAVLICYLPIVHAQPAKDRLPHRVVEAKEIQRAGYDQFRLTLHYLMPDVFPKTAEAWWGKISEFTIYVDQERCEPEYLDDIDPRQVKRITVWEKSWDIMPMALPSLAPSRYVVSIETI